MTLSLRARLAAALAAFRGRQIAPPAPPDVSAVLEKLDKMRADIEATKAALLAGAKR